MRWFWLNSEKFSHLGTIATAIVAVLALGVAVCQIQVANRSQREATAQEAYKDYVLLAVEHPALADGTPDRANESERPEGRYEWFVAYFLHSAEQIFLLFPDDEGWRNALAYQLCFHWAHLTGDEYQQTLRFHFAESFQKFVAEAIAACPAQRSN